jgi:MEMO1 family protein
LPLLCGQDNSFEDIQELADGLRKFIGRQTLVVASVDFTHYGPNYGFIPFRENISENLEKLDNPVIEYLCAGSSEKLYEYLHRTAITNDGRTVLPLLAEILKGKGYRSLVAGRESSGNLLGDFENSVSYASIIFYK